MRKIYEKIDQYKCISDLIVAIWKAWIKFKFGRGQKLIYSMNKRYIFVIEHKDRTLHVRAHTVLDSTDISHEKFNLPRTIVFYIHREQAVAIYNS